MNNTASIGRWIVAGFVLALALMLLAGCAPASTVSSEAAPSPTASSSTGDAGATPTVAAALLASRTPAEEMVPATPTPTPSDTAVASPTPTATRTPRPTATRWVIARLTATAAAEETAAPPATPTPPAGAVEVGSRPAPTPTLEGRLVLGLTPGGPIYIVNADGSGLTQIAHSMDPAWSPDGSLIAYTLWDGPRPGVYVVDPTTREERLIFGTAKARTPAWTPDGRSIVFTRLNGGKEAETICFPPFGCFEIPGDSYWRLGMVDLFDGSFRDIPSDFHSFAPAVSPDGKWVIYAGDRGLKRTALDETAQSALTDDLYVSSPALSPDGTRLVSMVRLHDHWDLFLMNADGSGRVQLTRSSGVAPRMANNVSPAWSPDGRFIVFLSDRDGTWKLYIMQADGSNQRPLLPDVLAGLPFDYQFAHDRVVDWTR